MDFVFGLGSHPQEFHCVHANIPKSEKIQNTASPQDFQQG
jgi:hypothetical protein